MGSDHEKIVNNFALLSDGSKVAATISGVGSAITLSGVGLAHVLTGNAAVADTGAGSANGNATIGFGSTAITGFSFDFKNDGGPPRFQSIGLFDINFTPVPEINPAWAGGSACLIAAFATFWRRRKARLTGSAIE
jgi:hypothetical protein